MSDREDILRAVRNNPLTPCARPMVPSFTENYPATPAAFSASLALMGGIWDDHWLARELDIVALTAYIRGLFPAAGVFCSAVNGIAGDKPLDQDTPPGALNEVDVAIVQARFAVAETGSIWLSEEECRVNALGYLAQHLVVLLPIEAILPNLHVAYGRSEFLTARYSVLMSGPSATADIEGVLIRGAQGVRSLRVIGLPAPIGA
jgi:L-lactate dehydrogenase complex protein LldG